MLTNYVPDPLAIGPQLLLQGSGATVERVKDSQLAARGRSYSVHSTTGEDGAARLPAAWRAPAAAGQPWAAAGMFRFDPTVVASQTIRLIIEFLNAQGTVIGTESAGMVYDLSAGFYETAPGSGLFVVGHAEMGPDRSYPADLFQQTSDTIYELTTSDADPVPPPGPIQVFGTAPEGTASVNVAVTGTAFFVTQLILVAATPATMPNFFTGASGPYNAWTGPANASTSLYYQTSPQLVPKVDRSPVERVEMTFREVLPGATYVNVWRVADGRTMEVRGGLRRYAVGGFPLIDYEAPFGVPITYRAEMFTDDTMTVSMGFTETAVTVLDAKQPCVHQPLNPAVAVWPRAMAGTAADVVRRTPGELVYVEGAEVGTWLGQQRRGAEGVDFNLLTESIADADLFQSVLGRYGESSGAVVCIRIPPPMRIPRTFFGTIDELHEVAFDVARDGGAVMFTFTANEARPPAPGLVPALLRRDDVDAAYPTRAERASAYLTRLDRDRDFTLAGLAG
ncbi:hypothetical protein EDF38_1312 [Frigoribacterium sp. PhB160]|uniref:hypothetical protein n=1 Tax=Frigoribacterium sp. PhB160 TaxID=2485192 RepID=UPI000F4A9245|nr:hypothetical protein [Frigoribacterium sp. PhB160]ROS62209.1 hypothetical protein EDF38_1312 [Frigoribacterium sp. PhB160]